MSAYVARGESPMLVLSLLNVANANLPAPDAAATDGASEAPPRGGFEGLLDGGLAPGADGFDVVNGTPVPEGKWDDAVGIVFSQQYIGCTGTLIGPRVVLTAGHCVRGIDVTHVLIGSKDWSDGNQGEIIEVQGVYEYPNSQETFDVAVLTLPTRSTIEPRALALDCIVRDFLEDGAPVQIVGFGATTASGQGFNTDLNEAEVAVFDKNCDESVINGLYAGCREPGGELAAGGVGQACYGDSGGPLYLKTGDGAYVVGVASRLFAGLDPDRPCDGGAIWVRPDAVVGWIEDQIGDLSITYPVCNTPPDAEADDIVTTEGVEGRTTVRVDDPDGTDDDATLAIAVEPEHGSVEVDGHDLVYTPDDGFVGEDTLTVTITDAGTDKPRTGTPVSIDLDVDVEVGEAVAATGDDDDDDAAGDEGSSTLTGCGCDGAGSGAVGALAAALVALTIRRRR